LVGSPLELLAGEGVKDNADVAEHGDGDERDERHDGSPGGGPAGAAPKPTEPRLHDVDEGQHQEPGPEYGSHGGRQDPNAQRGAVDPRRPADDGGGPGPADAVRVGADEQLEAQRDEAGEEEAREREHVEQDQVGLGAVPRRTGLAEPVGVVSEARAVGGGAPGQARPIKAARVKSEFTFTMPSSAVKGWQF
jgi:hypothetical protein